MDIPNKTHMFEIDLKGDRTNKRYSGDFTTKIMSLGELAKVEKYSAFLNGPDAAQLENFSKVFHYQIAYLKYALTKSPKWWSDANDGLDLYDYNVVSSVFDQSREYEDKWKENLIKDDEPKESKEVESEAKSD